MENTEDDKKNIEEVSDIAELETVSKLEEFLETEQIIHVSERNIENFPITLHLFKRTVIFTFLLLLSYLTLFLTGNYQNFLPSNVALILKVTTIDAIILGLSSVMSIFMTILYSILHKKPLFMLHLIFFIFTLIFSAVTAAATLSISKMAEGL